MNKLIALILMFFTGFAGAQNINPAEDEALVKIKVTTMDGKARPNDEIIFVSSKTGKTFKSISNSDGKSTIILKKADKYEVFYNNLNEKEKVQEFEIPDNKGKYSINLSLKYDPPRTITLKNVFFDSGKAILKKESFVALNELYDALKMKPAMVIEIAGHTDNVGNQAANQLLSEQRAVSVRVYLIRKGIDPKRIQAKGYGDTEPVAYNDNSEGRQQNRRTEVRIISE